MATFRIGLALAGAVSAGAYTAGVLDFLIEALDAWESAKKQGGDHDGRPVPMHGVSLVVSSGASAGSMCSALLAVALPYAFPHVRLDAQRRPRGETTNNPLYTSWVDKIGIEPLLALGDIPKGAPIPSYLNSGIIDEILKDCLQYTAPLKERPWVAQPFLTRLSVGNLRGVPYAVPSNGEITQADCMVEHADHLSFAISSAPLSQALKHLLADHVEMKPHPAAIDNASRQPWNDLGAAAVASGAFPLFLKPRRLSRPADDYNHRHEVHLPNPGQVREQSQRILPTWNQNPAPTPYNFVCMDGGIFNNEPFELAHSALLLEDNRTRNPRSKNKADSAVIMIDPFTAEAKTPDAFEETPIEPLIFKLISAWTMQARFKPKDLALAHDPNTFSRYLIAPVATGKRPTAESHTLACGGLGGFFGFFHEEFRKHDYQLGRRNCQQFLRQHFTIPDINPILKGGYKALDTQQRAPYTTQDGRELQIIPLMPHLQEAEPEPIRPTGLLDVESLRPIIAARVEAVYAHYVKDRLEYTKSSGYKKKIARLYLGLGWKLYGRKQVLELICSALDAERKKQGL